MYPTYYLALLSGLKCRKGQPRYCAAILDGDFAAAYCAVDDAADIGQRVPAKDRASANEKLTALADVSLLLGNHEEAESYYRRAQKTIWKDEGRLRVQSCRNTGWVSLLRGRFGVAQRGFARIIGEVESSVEERIEAFVALAIVHHQLAQPQSADEALQQAALMADAHEEPRFRLVVELLAQEFDVRLTIRGSRALNDHAFWHSAFGAVSLSACVGAAIEPAMVVAVQPTLLALRIDELHCMKLLACGERSTPATVVAARLKRNAPNPEFVFHAALDVVLAAFAGGLEDFAAEMMDHVPVNAGDSGSRDFDYLYCMAKVTAHRGDHARALRYYAQYTTETLRCLRTEVRPVRTGSSPRARSAAVHNDEVSARLPAKYRRAYRYIIENIERDDLTTRQVAAEMNVTMRTIQLVFKRALGMTPCGLIRSLRLEGIREDLLDENGPTPSICDAAARWGLKNRSTLAKGYRKHFNESPTETIVAHAR